MDWKDVASVVGKAAPIIGTILGGPLGGAVGGLVSSALGCENSPDAVSAAIAADPQAAEKLAEAQLNSKVQLQALLVQQQQNVMQNQLAVYQAEAGDRDSARKMANAPDWWIRPCIAIMLTVGVVAYCGFLLSNNARELLTNATASLVIGTIVGYLFGELKQVYAFYFGATKDGSDSSRAITNFAVSPGIVSSDPNAVASQTVINNAST